MNKSQPGAVSFRMIELQVCCGFFFCFNTPDSTHHMIMKLFSCVRTENIKTQWWQYDPSA